MEIDDDMTLGELCVTTVMSGHSHVNFHILGAKLGRRLMNIFKSNLKNKTALEEQQTQSLHRRLVVIGDDSVHQTVVKSVHTARSPTLHIVE